MVCPVNERRLIISTPAKYRHLRIGGWMEIELRPGNLTLLTERERNRIRTLFMKENGTALTRGWNSEQTQRDRRWSDTNDKSISQLIHDSTDSQSANYRYLEPRRSSSQCSAGPLAVYDPYGPQVQHEVAPIGIVPPFWQPPPPPQYPLPVFFPLPQPANFTPCVLPTKKIKKKIKREPSACNQLFCGGVAQLLWIIVGIIVTGMIAALILALIVV